MSNRLLAVALTMVLAGSMALAANETPSITVTGTATARVVPDRVQVTLEVYSLDMDLAKSAAGAEARVSRVLELTRKFKLDAQDVQTSFVNIGMKYEQEVFKGYAVTTGIKLTLRDIAVYDPFIREAVDVAHVLVHGISFESGQSAVKQAEGRLAALQDARQKAMVMAATLDQSIGRPLSIVEGDARPTGGWDAYGLNALFCVARASGDDVSGYTLAPGELEINVTVTVSFELKAR